MSGSVLKSPGYKTLQCYRVVDLNTFTGMARCCPGKGSTLEINAEASSKHAGLESGRAKAEGRCVDMNIHELISLSQFLVKGLSCVLP